MGLHQQWRKAPSGLRTSAYDRADRSATIFFQLRVLVLEPLQPAHLRRLLQAFVLLLPIEIGRLIADPGPSGRCRRREPRQSPSCRRMNAFWASENCDAFIVFCPSQPENTAENFIASERPSFRGVDHFIGRRGIKFPQNGVRVYCASTVRTGPSHTCRAGTGRKTTGKQSCRFWQGLEILMSRGESRSRCGRLCFSRLDNEEAPCRCRTRTRFVRSCSGGISGYVLEIDSVRFAHRKSAAIFGENWGAGFSSHCFRTAEIVNQFSVGPRSHTLNTLMGVTP